MTTFHIDRATRCNRAFTNGLADIVTGLNATNLRITDAELTINLALTADQVSAINALISAVQMTIAEQTAVKRANIDTFAPFRSREANQWRRALSPQRRAA